MRIYFKIKEMLMSQGAGKVLPSSVPKNQLTMVDGLVARHLRDTPLKQNRKVRAKGQLL